MNEQYYIAKIGNLWVNACYNNIGTLFLNEKKKYATHLTQEQIDWINESVPSVEVFEVKVTIEENIID